MYSILRIEGDRSTLESYCAQLVREEPGLKAKVTRRGVLAVDLSSHDSWDEHQWEVEKALPLMAPVIERARKDGCTAYVDCGVHVPPPSGEDVSVVVRTFRLRASLVQQLGSQALDFEFTVYVEPEE